MKRRWKILVGCFVGLIGVVLLNIVLVSVRVKSFAAMDSEPAKNQGGGAATTAVPYHMSNDVPTTWTVPQSFEARRTDGTTFTVKVEVRHYSRPEDIPKQHSPFFNYRLHGSAKKRAITMADYAFMRVYIGALKGVEAGAWLIGTELPAGAYAELGSESMRLDDLDEARAYLRIAERKLQPGKMSDVVNERLKKVEEYKRNTERPAPAYAQ